MHKTLPPHCEAAFAHHAAFVVGQYAHATTPEVKNAIICQFLALPRLLLVVNTPGVSIKSTLDDAIAAVGRRTPVAGESKAVHEHIGEGTDDRMKRLAKRAYAMVGTGHTSRGVRSLLNPPLLAPTSAVISAIEQLHPPLLKAMDNLVNGTPHVIVTPKMLERAIRHCANGSAPGPSGWTGELLQIVASHPIARHALMLIVTDISNGDILDDATRELILISRLCPGDKTKPSQPIAACAPPPPPPTEEKDINVRPIKVREALFRLACACAMDSLRPHYPKLFPTVAQVGCGMEGGVERGAHILRAGLDRYGANAALISIDYTNAYNTRSRAAMMTSILDEPLARPLARLFNWTYGSETKSLIYDNGRLAQIIDIREGVEQGCQLGLFAFGLSVTPAFTAAGKGLRATVVGCVDDWAVVGKWGCCLTAVNRLLADKSLTDLTINAAKSWIYWPSLTEPPPPRLLAYSAEKNIPVVRDKVVKLGACFSANPALIAEWATQCVARHEHLFRLLESRHMDPQSAYHLLAASALPRITFLMRTHPPEHILPALRAWDARVQRCFLAIAGIEMPALQSHQQALLTQMALPVKDFAGCGVTSAEQHAPLHFLASALLAASDHKLEFTRPTGYTRALVDSWHAAQAAGVTSQLIKDSVLLLFREHDRSGLTRLGSTRIHFKWARCMNKDTFSTLRPPAIANNHEYQVHGPERAAAHDRLSSAASKNASLWLNTRPTHPKYRLNSLEFRNSLRMRLGQPLSHFNGSCLNCGGNMTPDHLLTCNRDHAASTGRHNHIEDELRDLFTTAGCFVQRQPRVYPSLQSRAVNRKDAADLLIHFGDGRADFVDVTLCTPSAVCYHFPSRRAMKDRANIKHKHYDAPVAAIAAAAQLPYKVNAFVLETYGAISPEADQLLENLKICANHRKIVPSSSEPSFIKHAYRCISFALCRAVTIQLSHSLYHFSLAATAHARPIFTAPQPQQQVQRAPSSLSSRTSSSVSISSATTVALDLDSPPSPMPPLVLLPAPSPPPPPPPPGLDRSSLSRRASLTNSSIRLHCIAAAPNEYGVMADP